MATGALLLTLLLACGGADHSAIRPQTARVAIVTDRSNSIEHGDGAACAAVSRLAKALLAEETPFAKGDILGGLGNNLDRNEATELELWATADQSLPGTPRRLSEARLQRQFGMEDYAALVLQRAKRAEAVGAGFERDCRAAASIQNISPIYSALLAATTSLKNGCPPKSECLLIVQSDLVETNEPGLKSAVTALLRGKPVGADPLPAPIDLENRVSVFVCGFAASTDAVSEASRGKVLSLWKEKILIKPRRWVEQPVCPGYAAKG